ncbi:MAG: nicotinate-nicotinamide nucleotide adenylyltransferase [Pseudomonadota bacterium]|nr:nicotinate-nicotinamide nucleotide adenylyltransferase [Pseudomonadota bacterium]
MTKTIIVYGGTFDPLHDGHLLCVEAAKATFPHAAVHVYPTYIPLVDDTDQCKKPLLTFAERTCLLQRHFAADARVLVSTLEKDLPLPNLTYNLVQSLSRRYPQVKFILLCGQDQYQHFAAWEGAQALLLAGCDLAVIARPDALPIATITAALAKKFAFTLVDKQGCYCHAKFSIYSINHAQLAVSSTEVRAALRNKNCPDNVPAVVSNYLEHKFAKITNRR